MPANTRRSNCLPCPCPWTNVNNLPDCPLRCFDHGNFLARPLTRSKHPHRHGRLCSFATFTESERIQGTGRGKLSRAVLDVCSNSIESSRGVCSNLVKFRGKVIDHRKRCLESKGRMWIYFGIGTLVSKVESFGLLIRSHHGSSLETKMCLRDNANFLVVSSTDLFYPIYVWLAWTPDQLARGNVGRNLTSSYR
jgi:hypothetical protein